jgi:hypothetical protein
MHFSLRFMFNTKALAKFSLEVLPRGRHRPLLNSTGVIISPANSLFLTWKKVKSLFRPCQMCEEGEKTRQAAKLLFKCVYRKIYAWTTTKSSKGIRRRWRFTTFDSPSVFSKPSNLEDSVGEFY